MRESRSSWIDVLAIVGLLLVGAAVYLSFGVAAVLAYAGAACVVLAVVLAMMPRAGGNDGGQR